MQRRFASAGRTPRHIVMTGRAWHEGGSAEAAGNAGRCARSGGVVATASMRRWRAGGAAGLPSGWSGAVDAIRGAASCVACATEGAAHASAASAYRQATAVREPRRLRVIRDVPGPVARRACGACVDCTDGEGRARGGPP
ncbi:hypothetical protein BPA30113_01414 [Burkholderia paludis]|uniref:Uncharacterized protein n=1 Tax=Burkholderia paludis TaxID=1506587 RepID=A0A6J5DMI3_9BURK|nr:hypothetical protein LMG30113_02422 [Burkholderia paludis]VWB35452.1 hypothetical protein BPA30113_01414 [Burkholderia paludis]